MVDRLGPYLLGPNETPECGIYTGDARLLAEALPDESVDLVLCDPVYWEMSQYEWLAGVGARTLKPGGNCIAQTGHYYLPSVLSAMTGRGLDYVWVIAEHLWGKQAQLFQHRIIVSWKPHVWFAKGRRNGDWVLDWMKGGGINKQNHEWGDSPEHFTQLVARLMPGDGILLDPFTGGGTVPAVCKMLGRRYLAFEIDPAVAERARQRVRDTQPAWPEMVAQLALDLELPPC